MKRGIIIFLLLIPLVQALGVTPPSESFNFKPNLIKELSFTFIPTNANTNTSLSMSGDLAQYVTLSKNQLTNQVYSDFYEKDSVKMVGGDILRNASRCIIELQKFSLGKRRAFVRKHRSISEKFTDFTITEKGIK